MRSFCTATLVVCVLATIGCGDRIKRVPVEGKLTFKGQPVAGAELRLYPTDENQGAGAMARTGADGSFTLADVRGAKGGVVPGEYKVTVRRYVQRDGSPLPPGAKTADHPDARESMPRALTSLEQSPLKTTIPPEGGSITIEIPASLSGR